MTAVFDENMMMRDGTADLTQDETLDAVKIKSTPIKGAAVRCAVPKAATVGGTINVKVHGSDDNSTYVLIAQSGAIVVYGGKDIIVPFSTGYKYVKGELDVTDTTPDFGAVKVGVVHNIGKAWARAEFVD